MQFPNIYRISLKTLDELIQLAKQPDFRIRNSFATVYLCADCSFFEDLPPNINDEQILSAIAKQIGDRDFPPGSFYVQYNKKAGNAIVLASKSVSGKWITESNLIIDEHKIPKKSKLAYRVQIDSIPRGFDIKRILQHSLFVNRIGSHKHIDDKLILEMNDRDSYETCLNIGGFAIDDHLMRVTPHTNVSDSDCTDLNAINWYETAMLDMKPDIMTVINEANHITMRSRWNADQWLEQMRKAERLGRGSKKYNLTQHLLRVTVMLNTISTVRKRKYFVDSKEVVLKCERLRTIGYEHLSKLSYSKKVSEKEFKTPYSSTTVKVVNEDCLVLYEKLVSQGRRPLLLNMANATSSGGGYRKGDGAQEENIFRRSDCYQSLDGEIADADRSERLFRTSKGELKPFAGYGGLYPIPDFGAIYTSGITVFRQTEANGYAYMKNPLYNVCAIAMPAYRNPKLTRNNMLENKFAVSTHKKIENIFAIAHENKHDCLVLSAFGCGAFRNPPEHIAALFKSVIYQYAGYFETIYFAIVDDHNTGNAINPLGNFLPFQRILDGLIVRPPTTLRVNGASGPYRILDKVGDQLTLSDACILYLPPCQHGTKCQEIKDAAHNNSYIHPSLCLLQHGSEPCDQINDEVHRYTFIHSVRCRDGGRCSNTNSQHLNEYEHPEFCKDGSHCTDVSLEHLSAYRHLPMCRYGLECSFYLRGEQNHCESFRHCKAICPYDNCCVYFHDKKHMENTIHTFQPPCPFTPYNCHQYVQYLQSDHTQRVSREIENHCLKYSHICPFGRQCTNIDDERHLKISIHIARQICPDGHQCSQLMNEDHLDSFSHSNIRDIRLFCKYDGYKCLDRSQNEHLKKYRHGKNYCHHGVARYAKLNAGINFVQNQGHLLRLIKNYVDVSNWQKAKISPTILNWILALQPVHRCKRDIFESILLHGHVMSRQYMKLLVKPQYVVQAVKEHSRVRLIFMQHNNPIVKENASKLIEYYVRAEFEKKVPHSTTRQDQEYQINVIKQKLKSSLTDYDIKVIYDWSIRITQAAIKLNASPTGIGYGVDHTLRTDEHVFGILGPHLGHYYGDIVIIFKPELMLHPDSNFSIQAGTRFHSGTIYGQCPWFKVPGHAEERAKDFHHMKLHCSIPSYENAAATTLVATTGLKNKSMNIDLSSLMDRWCTVDSHEVFEAHLPQLIPLDYIDTVYIPKNAFESLSHHAQENAKKALGHSLHITDHQVDLTLEKAGATVTLDVTRQPYLKFIIEKITKKIKERSLKVQIPHGFDLTVSASRFEEYISLPLKISDSYYLYSLNAKNKPNTLEFTYIYWQAMYGDMMIVISNERIEMGTNQLNLRCLTCYVAETPSTKSDEYREEYSYINDGLPYQHEIHVRDNHLRARSGVFYCGCKIDDFFTFCLKINHHTSEATLSHAGPNGIYNHEKISYQFKKKDLDLSRIDYIHVSAGSQDVPIRHLRITHEPIPELHPSFDKDFRVDTSNLIKIHRSSVPYVASLPPLAPQAKASRPSRERSRVTADAVAQGRIIRASSTGAIAKSRKPSIFRRVIDAIFGSSTVDKLPKSDAVRSRSNSGAASSHSEVISSRKLPPCPESVYCLQQQIRDHTEKYSHPCRFNELCRNKATEFHLVHESHKVSKCPNDLNCPERTNPVHRAKCRHTDLPDYLIPCRYQEKCYDRSEQHRMKFFHGEELPNIKKSKTLVDSYGHVHPRASRIPCRYGDRCRDRANPSHCARFSHPT